MTISRRSITVLCVICAIMALVTCAGATSWDLSSDWSATNNPNGAWSYGYSSSTVAGPMTRYVRATNPPTGQTSWAGTSNYYETYLYGAITRTTSGGAVVLTNGTASPYYQATARWTSPVTGSIHVWGRFSWNITSGVLKGRAYIRQNGVQKYSAIAANWNTYYTWDAQVTVAAGDTIDFICAPDPAYPDRQNNFVTFAAITTDAVGTVTGVVRDTTAGHAGIPFAQIATSDGRFIAVCGSDGSYSLSLPQGNYTLIASANNFSSQTVSGIAVSGGNTSQDFSLGTPAVSGTVISDEPGSPALSGATVRTLGEASYSATTASDGSYSLALPGGSYTLLASAAGHDPMRVPVSVTAGSGTSQSFALRPSAAGAGVALPAPLDWGEPPSAPTPPGDDFATSFADMNALPVAGAPRIGGWNETVKPDESFTLTGAAFTTRTGADLGTDTTVWVWAATASGGVLKQARVWKVTGEMLTATLPDDIPYGMFLVWVQNSLGVSPPICMNRTRTTYIGPTGNVGWAGATMRVFGKNITRNRTTNPSSVSVYIQPAAGGAFTACSVTRADPYSAEFIVPAGTSNGNYRVFVHNGHGGVYGWSDPLDLVIAPQWVRGSYQCPVTPSGGNDNTRIQSALTAAGAQTNGGTVLLSAGTFYITTGMNIPGNVELRGAGPDQTTINVQVTAGVRAFNLLGSHIAMTDLTTYEPNGPVNGWDGLLQPPYYIDSTYNRFSNVKFTGSPSTSAVWMGRLTEVVNCTFGTTAGTGDASWIHGCSSIGSRYSDGWEAAYYMGTNRCVFEFNHIETPNWPYDPSKPHPYNYGENLTSAQYGNLPWNKRVALIYSSDLYAANNTTKDVAASDPLWQGNTGEMLLAHGYPAQWFGNVIGSSGQTLVLRTDGLVNNQVVTMQNYTVTYQHSPDQHPLTGGQVIPDGYEGQEWYSRLDGPGSIYAVTIIAGKGMGQFRRITSHTPSSVTVDTPWLVQPDSTSVASIARLYLNNTIYKNDLNAYPQGYVQGYSASIGVVIDGHGWGCSIEGNTSHRTCEARQITSGDVSSACWNEMRDEASYDVFGTYHEGNVIFQLNGDVNPAGLTSIGNAFRGGQVNMTGGQQVGGGGGANGAMSSNLTAGAITENVTITGKRGIALNGLGNLPPYGSMLTRKCAVSVFDIASLLPSTPEPIYIAQYDENQILNRNTYAGSGWTQTYCGIATYITPLPLNRCARIKGYVGGHLDPAVVPIANGGSQSMTWSATPSDPWITATVGASPTVSAEGDAGRLIVSVNPSGMTAGQHWGYVTVSTGVKTVRVGVCVDLASGPPSQQSPIASFTASPVGGIAPVTTTFDAGASTDPDGSIVSYAWDFGDGTGATGVTASHVYSTPGVFLVTLKVTDDSGNTGLAAAPITAGTALTAVSISGNPGSPVSAGTPVTLTAVPTGGYNVSYKFLLRNGNTWSTLQDFSSSATVVWTPPSSGYYAVRVLARSAGSLTSYDAMGEIAYPVDLVPANGMALWLRGDSGVSLDATGNVSSWDDQSGAGNNVSQTTSGSRPAFIANVLDGKPAIRFGTAGQLLQSSGLVISGTSNFTAFTAAKFNTLTPNIYQYIWWNGTNDQWAGYGAYGSSTQKLRSAWGSQSYYLGDPDPNHTIVAGVWYEISSRYTSGNHEAWINGTHFGPNAKTGSNFNAGGFFSVGNFGPDTNNRLFYGDVGEILIYNRYLSDTERSNVEAYLLSKWSTPTPVSVSQIAAAKALADQTIVSITSPKVATCASDVFSDSVYYILEPDRTCGMKVVGSQAVNLWENLTLTGTIGTDANGEKLLQVSSIDSRSAGTSLGTLGMNNKACAPSGQLVRVWGKVTSSGSGWFRIDDGSGTTMLVASDTLVAPLTQNIQIGRYVGVTGIAGKGTSGATVVRPRSDSDVQLY